MAGGTIQSVLGNDHQPNWSSLAASSFGNAVGDQVAGSLQAAERDRFSKADVARGLFSYNEAYDLKPPVADDATARALGFRGANDWALMPERGDEGPIRYIVRKGDTFTSIARNMGRTAAEIALANGMVNQFRLRPGQSLVIPGAGSYSDDDLAAASTFMDKQNRQRIAVQNAARQQALTEKIRAGVPLLSLKSWVTPERVSDALLMTFATAAQLTASGSSRSDQLREAPGVLESVGNTLRSDLPLGQKLSWAWGNVAYSYRGSDLAQGLVQAGSGAMEVGASVPLASSGAGSVIAVPLAFHGADNIEAGLRRAFLDGDGSTLTYRSVLGATGSPYVAQVVDQAIPFAAGAAEVGVGMAQVVNIGNSQLRVTKEFAGGTNQYVNDLSPYTGSRVRNGNRAINAIINEDFPDLSFTYRPSFSPYAETGVTGYAPFYNPGVQIGYKSLYSRSALRDTIIHEELHNRWRYFNGILENHHYPGGDLYPVDLRYRDLKFYATVERYKSMRGWDYSQSTLDEWSAYVKADKAGRAEIVSGHF
ncbi:hypothetical protein B0T37_21905 [Chromobacterium violaceum]|uniref:LysM peptidoglycan-binding domain-containing protein n=1 Tax=Chromobacterium violaceum TaxID=536 RepID=UPI0009DA7499|nr:LysM peptidoglycan-binding domain-containing protein [Chromobacterium violaceum]OQS08110.1 hypothetical protein B0T38_21915 [Chromobacterium violaceum]OQS20230.1 hypothetical protein B0T37_21905 [Chromobacterium violaceum]